MLLHVGAVALLASYRTGLKLALWHSLLLLRGRQRRCAAAPSPARCRRGRAGLLSTQRIVVFVVVLWLVAIRPPPCPRSTSASCAAAGSTSRRSTRLAERLERASDSAGVARMLLDSLLDASGLPAGRGRRRARGAARRCSRPPGSTSRSRGAPVGPDRRRSSTRAHRSRSAALVRSASTPVADPWLARLLPGRPGRHRRAAVRRGPRARARSCSSTREGAGRVPGRVQRRVLSRLERSAAYASLALRNAWLLEQLRRLASTDGLTKIANRRTFESTLEREVARGHPQHRAAEPGHDRHRPLQAPQRRAGAPGRRRGAAQRRGRAVLRVPRLRHPRALRRRGVRGRAAGLRPGGGRGDRGAAAAGGRLRAVRGAHDRERRRRQLPRARPRTPTRS